MDPPIPPQTTTTSGGDTAAGGPSDPTTIVKRKRTKRHRPTTNINLTHSSSYNTFNLSPSSSDSPAGSTTTADEDTANCLILLSRRVISHSIYSNNDNNNNNNNSNMAESSLGYKFTSKKYIQTSSNGANGLTGTYVYECKTCSRTFPTFQALGGHRASHTKPRITESEKQKQPAYMGFSDEDDSVLQIQAKKNYSSSSSKLHECSICGAEFNSGQALGGHMRRHRSSTSTSTGTTTGSGTGTGTGTRTVADNATNTALSLVPYSAVAVAGTVTVPTVVVDDLEYRKSTGDDGLCLGLDLDLNLPAPPDMCVGVLDQEQEVKSRIMFSATPTLVDCHY